MYPIVNLDNLTPSPELTDLINLLIPQPYLVKQNKEKMKAPPTNNTLDAIKSSKEIISIPNGLTSAKKLLAKQAGKINTPTNIVLIVIAVFLETLKLSIINEFVDSYILIKDVIAAANNNKKNTLQNRCPPGISLNIVSIDSNTKTGPAPTEIE